MKFISFKSSASLTPPHPKRRSSSSDANVGQKLLTMLRTLERMRENDEDDQQLMEEFVVSFSNLTANTLREGLLFGDVEQACQILAVSATASTAGANKRHRSAAWTANEGDEAITSSTALDTQLLISTVTRMLDSPSRKSSIFQSCWDVMVKLAADFLHAWACFLASQDSVEPSVLAEYELLASNGKQLLSLLCSSSMTLLKGIPVSAGGVRLTAPDDNELMATLASCLNASAVLLVFFGTKLSRSVQLIKDLGYLALSTIAITDRRVVEAAADLNASLPCAGGLDGATPASIWESNVRNFTRAISLLVRAAAMPINPGSSADLDATAAITSSGVCKVATESIEQMRSVSAEQTRLEAYTHILNILCVMLCKLLESPPASVTNGCSTASINVAAILELLEEMVSSPIKSENTYHNTKKRLRFEIVAENLMSPSAMVHHVANLLQQYGLAMMTCVLDSLGGPCLAPFATPIRRIITSSLLSSSTVSVRGVVDPTAVELLTQGHKRWLHNSVVLRTMAVKTFRSCLQALDGDLLSLTSHGARHTVSLTEQSVLLVGGIVIEILTVKKDSTGFWGNAQERNELLNAALSCLETTLLFGGEYMSLNLRQFVDSVTKRSFSVLFDGESNVCTSNSINAIISLGTSCVLTSWPDGSTSWLVNDLLTVTRHCQSSCSAETNGIFARALTVCNAAFSPRVPALLIRIPDRKRSTSGSRRGISVSTFMEVLQKDGAIQEGSRVAPTDEEATEGDPSVTATRKMTLEVAKASPGVAKTAEARKRPIHQISSEANQSVVLPTTLVEDRDKQLPLETSEQVAQDVVDFDFPNIVDMGPDEDDQDDE